MKQRFPFWFTQISRALSQELADYVGTHLDLTLAEFRVLGALADLQAASVKDIAADVSLDKAQVTRAIADLAKRKLVRQAIDSNDRRLRAVRPTQAGLALYAQSLPFMRARHQRLARGLTSDELKIFWKGLRLIAAEANLQGDEHSSLGVARMRKDKSPTT